MVRTYAQVIGVILLVLAVLGLALGDQSLGGALNIDLVEDAIHLVTGAILVLAGYGRVGAGQARSAVAGVGIFYLVLALLGFVDASLFGLLPSGYSVVDNLVHVVIGLLLVFVAQGARSAARTTTSRRRGR